MKAALPANETARLETLHQSGLLDSLPEQAYDDITLLASHICGTPMAVMSLVDGERQWFKSKVGIEGSETPREHSFCAHAILEPQSLFIVPDARLDPRFADNPAVVADPSIRFYAGAPLVTPEGHALGSLCVVDRKPRVLTEIQKQALQALSRQVMAQFTLHEQTQQLQSLNEQLERLSVRDELTGVNNRRAFNAALSRELARARRYDAPLSLVMLDVDNFKKYNDSFGHQAGDEVLRKVGQILPQHLSEMGVAARYGGEEFALILPDTDAQTAQKIAEALRIALETASWPQRAITASLGVATTSAKLQAETALLAAADAALYAAKHAGRNRVMHCRDLS
ncbi:MAG TPA: sensor domain-containing diguanylate cyclase [Abditibacterium sp.]|jgi:diguanylate cyclase (GGDEF)-like protein